MPMIRYEIRNEYNLADPEVYRAADKDDPEALLEGVAMVGLVGVLRQLGDLAEFAAAIFHNLHEEVMGTASRGHSLMIRVEQLEAEIPSIEKLFLSQTDHSSLFYNGGVDLHPNLQMDQNLITQGDLPRFIMDSYEECRGPPRLFLLDKFDVAGAGACLKRYTDPSFFGVETSSSGMTKAYVQREKRAHKVNQKKELNWRNGETSEVIPTSHAKLHQLFLKESVTNSISNPARRVKLKRRPNGVPFDSKNGERYMEKLLRNPSPEHNVVHEVSVSSSLLKLPTHDHNESGVEVLEVIPLSPDMGRKSSLSSPNTQKIMLKPSVYESIELSADDSLIQVPKSITSFEAVDISCAFDLMTSEDDITVDEESKEGSLNGYHSDDVSTEIDYYVDAPSTIESDMYTDSEWRGKSDFTSCNMKKQLSISNTDDEYLQSHSSDSQSIGHSSIVDEGNNSYKKETYNFSSDSVEMDGITCCMDSTGNKETDIISPNGVHVQFVEIDPETDQYDAVDVATVVTGSAVNADENDFLSVGHMLKEGCIPFYGDSSHDDFKTDKYWYPYSHGESILVEEVDQLEVATSHLDSVDNVPNSCIPLEVENSLNLVNTTVIKLSLEKRGLYTEQESEQKRSLSSRTEDASYLPINPHTEETILQETIGLLPNTLDLEFPEAGETDLELLPPSKSMQKFDHNDHQGCNNSTLTLSDLPQQGNYENDYFGHPKNLSSSIFPLINLHSETNQINLEESPPLPPLPPLQWRIGKLNNTYRATERETEQHNVSCLSSVLPMEADEKAQSLLPNLPLSAVIKKDSPSVDDEMTQDCFLAGEGKIMLHTLKSSSRGISLDSPSVDDVGSSFEELNQSLHQVAAEITSKEDKAEYNSSCLQSNIMKHETVELLPMKDNEKPLLVLPPSEYEITLPVAEDGIENGSRTTKLPRPRNPLIDAVVAHDKSKLRKVTERVRPQMQSIDEKGSFLEQIRTKSFNLKPAVMAKPSIQGPNTNLKIAALLEKAKTIRQALASSDEDDEDSWSDS